MNLNHYTQNRRRFLQFGTLLAAGFISTPTLAKRQTQERTLHFYNLHTEEKLSSTYWSDGHYQRSELNVINRLLRDHRTDEITQIDPLLLDLLHHTQQKLGSRQPLHIISAYRSQKTNTKLRQRSHKVAKRSLHTQGRAIDFFLPDRELHQIQQAALSLHGGGVGYYPRGKIQFVHMDTGRVRRW
ncbi:MAG: DUF882 domain-containing protein [Gammaproteobacteria bacterium]|nr:DUF882 domain-containing protein [Gammaproteobacteria bacterium]